jgi:hypothetical protein
MAGTWRVFIFQERNGHNTGIIQIGYHLFDLTRPEENSVWQRRTSNVETCTPETYLKVHDGYDVPSLDVHNHGKSLLPFPDVKKRISCWRIKPVMVRIYLRNHYVACFGLSFQDIPKNIVRSKLF